MTESLADAAEALRKLEDDITAYVAAPPPAHRYHPPVIDWHHDDYGQTEVQGMTKFLSQVAKERCNVDQVAQSSHPPADYSTNLVALQGVWDAFLRSEPPLVGIWNVLDRKAGPGGGSGAGATKVDVVARGGDEWVKINTVKETRLLIEFREHDSYINSDYEDDEDTPELTNSLLTQARALIAASRTHARPAGLEPPAVRYLLTRLERSGHSDARVGETMDMMRKMGITVEFASEWGELDTAPAPLPAPAVPSQDVVLDLSVLIALCCDSTHYPLPASDAELQARFCVRNADGSMVELRGACRDLRDQLACEIQRPLMEELKERLSAGARFWVTREVHERLPSLVDVIGGQAERARARALFHDGHDFWDGSRWKGNEGVLKDIRVRVIEDAEASDDPPPPTTQPTSQFDNLVIHVCTAMIAAGGDDSPPLTPAPGQNASPLPAEIPTTKPTRAPKPVHPKKVGNASKSPLRPGTIFPPGLRLPSGHTLRTMLASVSRQATLLTNNRGAVLKVLREAGVSRGIPRDHSESASRARIWVVNPSSLAEWRRIEVEESIARAVENGAGALSAGALKE